MNNENRIPEEEEVFEEKKGLSEKTLKIALGAVIAALVVVVVIALVLFKSGSNEETTTLPPEESTLAEEITTNPADKYATGKYTVNAGEGQTLNFRKSYEKDAELYTGTIPNGTELVITEVKYIPTADEAFRYMGKTTFRIGEESCEGWVAMYYLASSYSNGVAPEATTGAEQTTDAEQTTGAEQTTEAVASEQTTAASVQEQTTAASVQEQTTLAPVTNSGKPTTPGTYTVDSDTGFIRLRSNHSVDGDSLVQIDSGDKITVTEVYENTNATDKTLRYWGKVSYVDYLGKTHNGWVAMWYLK